MMAFMFRLNTTLGFLVKIAISDQEPEQSKINNYSIFYKLI